MDDIFVVYSDGHIDEILGDLHKFHLQKRLTVAHEENSKLSFLDVLVRRKNSGTYLSLRIPSKPTQECSTHHPNPYLR
jgi:hypothetical protein